MTYARAVALWRAACPDVAYLPDHASSNLVGSGWYMRTASGTNLGRICTTSETFSPVGN